MKKPVVLVILDGYGITASNKYNAITLAKKPNLDRYFENYPNILLDASGEAVGLPDGQMGNSEVGHLNIGAGRTVFQSLTRINISIKDNSFFENEVFINAIKKAKTNGKKLHIMGLLSDGGVHSHITHFKAMLHLAKQFEVSTFVHGILDGRDTSPKSGIDFVTDLESFIQDSDFGTIATLSGRYYAMDRDKNYDRTKMAYDLMTLGLGKSCDDAKKAVLDSYENGLTDEFFEPTVINKNGLIEEGDSVIFMNFRPDRAIQLSTMLTNMDSEFVTTKSTKVSNIEFVCMMSYADYVKGSIAFKLEKYDNLLGEVLSNKGLKQLRIAETEKYAHVTFFFDGGKDVELKGADRILVASPKVATYDLKPEMSAYEVTSKFIDSLEKGYDVVIMNFANCDMVGHTGNLEAAIRATEVVDDCVSKVVEKVNEMGGVCLLTADHGNAEKMANDDGSAYTSHTTSLVPFVITSKEYRLVNKVGTLADIAPTILELLKIEKPKEMTGSSLIEN